MVVETVGVGKRDRGPRTRSLPGPQNTDLPFYLNLCQESAAGKFDRRIRHVVPVSECRTIGTNRRGRRVFDAARLDTHGPKCANCSASARARSEWEGVQLDSACIEPLEVILPVRFMENTADPSLREETAAWCDDVQRTIREPGRGCADWLRTCHRGVLLRRRWDREDPEAPLRRRLIGLLPATQNLARCRLTECVEGDRQSGESLTSLVAEQLAEDDRYLVGLLGDAALSADAVAFCVECFRDDLHWLGTQVAVLDGNQGVDFLGRILLEQEALEHEIDAWEDQTGQSDGPPGAETPELDASGGLPFGELRSASHRLRDTALARQVSSLVDYPESQDCPGWYRTWQAASRLKMRLDPDAIRVDSADACQSVEAVRRRAVSLWRSSVAELPEADGAGALSSAAGEISDTANESLTFLEDLSAGEAVRSLEVIDEDLETCITAVKEHPGAELRGVRRTLRRCRAALAGELQERRLSWRMASLFGHRFEVALEWVILCLLLIFMVMLVVEEPLLNYEAARGGFEKHTGQSLVEPVFAWADLAICLVFLGEFGLKMCLARRRWLFFKRNWLTGLLPAIPVGFIAYAAHSLVLAEEGEWVVLLRALRYLRLPRMVRWLRIARPVLRVVRLVGFALKASDRLVRQLTPLLNRNLVLFERAAISVREPVYRTRLAQLRERFYHRACAVIHEMPQSDRVRFVKYRIDDLTAMLSSSVSGPAAAPVSIANSTPREMPLERTIARLLAATPAGISSRIGRTLAQRVARWCKTFDLFGIRRLPLVREIVAAGRLPSPYETTAQVANRIGLVLKQLLGRVYWVADLYGTVTAPQLVDSMGEYMVKGSARPARRLVMIGVGFLAVTYMARLMNLPTLNMLAASLQRLVAWPLVVLGGLCLLVFGLGVWFRRIAGEATDFYMQVAHAQLITATKKLKQRLAQRHHAVLHRRVIFPEMEMAADMAGAGDEAPPDAGRADHVDGARAAVDLLWHDYLDGAPFQRDDTRTTNQLLGNLVLISLRETRLQYDRRRKRLLRRLDLTTSRMSMRGPYLWFHFISRSVAQHTAKLVVDYNAFALPLSRAAVVDAAAVTRYVEWLGHRQRTPIDRVELPEPFRRRWEGISKSPSAAAASRKRGRRFEGNDFTAIHFLSADPEIDADIRRRYGDRVAELMRRDRRDNVRRVFRTYPFHRWPKERRTFNPLSLYQRHLEGGRVLLLPLKMLWWVALAAVRAVGFVCSIVGDVVNPNVGDMSALEESDPFEVAVRKIHRMRRPLFLECLRMRADFDPEYLGLVPPGAVGDARGAGSVQIDEDLDLIRAEPGVKREFRLLAAQRRRQLLDFRYWLNRLDCPVRSRRSLRAMAIAYTIDYQGLRSLLEATRLLEKLFAEVDAERSGVPEAVRSWSLGAAWCRRRLAERFDNLFTQPAFSGIDDVGQSACRGAIYRRRGLTARAVKLLTEESSGSGDPVDDARALLLEVARDPDTWSRQLVVLRAVQTLSVLDLTTYCDLVAELGEYDTCSAEMPEDMMPGV